MNISEYDYDSEGSTEYEVQNQEAAPNLISRCVIHLDINYFYCQCEEIANPTLATRPVAIGQKHIIVTSNYVARSMGVKKLQSKSEALGVCPSLLIIDGSDIERYRDASTSIYATFRQIVKGLHSDNTVRKGGMDEYFADVTSAVESQLNHCGGFVSTAHDNQSAAVWIYGDDEKSSTVQIVEDQTGATSISTLKKDYNSEFWGSKDQITLCVQKLHVTTNIAKMIQDKIRTATSFSSSVGISVSPMLAKIASGLRKPSSCNVLYPWRCHSIVETMPLQRVPDVGSKTMKALKPLLEKFHVDKNPEFWMCRDLLDIPQNDIQSCLKQDKTVQFCNLLIHRCRGIDMERLRDDGGALSKTISVENSFRRGTVTCTDKVVENIDTLIYRLLKLLRKRTISSHSPSKSFPRVIRLTARNVPFQNMSKQMKFDGKTMLQMTKEGDQVVMIRKAVGSLLDLFQGFKDGINVTRLNLAMTSFADLDQMMSNESRPIKKKSIAAYFQPKSNSTFDNADSHFESLPKADESYNMKPRCIADVIHNLKLKQMKNVRHKKSSVLGKRQSEDISINTIQHH